MGAIGFSSPMKGERLTCENEVESEEKLAEVNLYQQV